MVVSQHEKIRTESFFNEHNQLLQQSSKVYEMLTARISSLETECSHRQKDTAFIEEIISWKSDFKNVFWELWDNLEDHVERETAFLDSFTERGLDAEELKNNEAVLEHLDEMNWLINNTPARQMSMMLCNIQQKTDELFRAVREHCQWSNEILKRFAEGE